MMRPPMAAMGPLSRCQSSGGLPRHCETGATDRTLGKSILNQIPTSAAAPRLCDVPPTATIPSLRIFEHVAESGEALGERYERLHRGLVKRLTQGVYVVGVAHGEKRNAFTAAWIMQVSFDPLLLALSINPQHSSYQLRMLQPILRMT